MSASFPPIQSMSGSSANSTRSVKRLIPNAARSVEEQRALNQQLFTAALTNEPELVLHYLSQGADPSAIANIGFETPPDQKIHHEYRTPENQIVPAHVKFSATTAQTTVKITALHAAIINCCWKAATADTIKTATSKVARIVKALLEAGSDTRQRATFVACHIPDRFRRRLIMINMATPLDFAYQLEVAVREGIDLACAQELQCVIDLLYADFTGNRDRGATTADRVSHQCIPIHSATLDSYRALLNTASEALSDIVFECADDTVATSSDLSASADSSESTEDTATCGSSPKRAKKAAAVSFSSSSSSDELLLFSNTGHDGATSVLLNNRIHAHRNILFASSPYIFSKSLFGGVE